MAAHQDWIRQLEAAFPPALPPKAVASSIGREVKPEGAAEIEAEFLGKTWTELPSAAVLRQAPSLSALTVDAFVCYLPAFLKAAALDPVDEGSAYVMYALAPLAQLESYSASTCRLFSPAQAEVIAGFLEILSDDESFVYLRDELPPAIGLWRRRSKESS